MSKTAEKLEKTLTDQDKNPETYADYRRKHNWIENSLARADEDESLHFDWKLVRMFVPYLKRYKTPTIWRTRS